MASEFIADGRIGHVEALFNAYKGLAAGETRTPCLFSLEASPGQGKTRIVQEFYERIASEQVFWPPSLVPDGVGAGDTRKHFALPSRVSTQGGKIPFVWLGIECERNSRGELSADLSQALRFLSGVLPSVFESDSWTLDDWLAEFRGQGKDIAISTAMSAVGLTFDAFIPASGVVRLGGERLHGMLKRRQARRLEESARDVEVDLGLDEEVSLAIAHASRRRPNMPIILVIEDSHFATEQLCSTLVQLLRRDNTRRPAVMVVATGWPELLDDDGNVFGSLLEELADSGVNVDRRRLEPFAVSQAAQLVLSAYPDTDETVAEAIAAQVDGNPYGVRLLLELRDVQAYVNGDRIDMQTEDVTELPNQLSSIYVQLWDELDQDVRDVLAIAALQESQPVVPLTEFMAQRLLNSPAQDPAGLSTALERAIDPYRWIRRFEQATDLVRFYEPERFRLADDHNIRPHRLEAPRLIEEFVVAHRANDEDWDLLSEESQRRLLELHTSAAKADPTLDRHQAALSLFRLGGMQSSLEARRDSIIEAAAAAQIAEAEDPEGTLWFEFSAGMTRKVPLSLEAVRALSAWAGGAAVLNAQYQEFLHLLRTGCAAEAVDLVAGVVPASAEPPPAEWLFREVRAWAEASDVSPDEAAWRRLVLKDVARWGGDEAVADVSIHLERTLNDERVDPELRSRTRRMLAQFIRKEQNDIDLAVAVLLGGLDDSGISGQARSWLRRWASSWLVEAGEEARAHQLLLQNLDDDLPPSERGLTWRDLARFSRDQLNDPEAAATLYRDWIDDPLILSSQRSSARQELAWLLSTSDQASAIELLQEDLRDSESSDEDRVDSLLALARIQLNSEPSRAIEILNGIIDDPGINDLDQRAKARALARKVKAQGLRDDSDHGSYEEVLDEMQSDPNCPFKERNWAVCELAASVAVRDPDRARQLLLAEADDTSQFAPLRKRARQLLSDLGLEI